MEPHWLQESHVMHHTIVLCSALLLCTACSPKTDATRDRSPSTASSSSMQPAAKPKRPPAKGCRADKFSRFPKLPVTPQDLACAKDSDCTVSNHINGSCCDHGCNARWVYTEKLLQKLRARQKECCDGVKLDCPLYRCPRDRFEHSAKCVSGRCKHIQTPAPWTHKKQN